MKPRHLQTRERIPDRRRIRAWLSKFTDARLDQEYRIRLYLANPDQYEAHNFYTDTAQKIKESIEQPPCCYCGDVPLQSQRNESCAHPSTICEECLVIYFRNYLFRRPCGRKFKDGTRCTEIAQFRLRDLRASKVVHKDDMNCVHGFVLRFEDTNRLKFRCPATGCQALCTMETMNGI